MSPQELIPGILSVAKKAGDAIMEIYHSDFSFERKDDHSPLTLADKRSHRIITDFLRSSTGLPVLSEEGKKIPFADRKEWEYFWLIDPLDGTKEFISRNGEFTVNIALVFMGRPVIGIICVPDKKTFYFGAAGIGAYKLLDDAETVVSFPENTDLQKGSTGVFHQIISKATRLPVEHGNRVFTVIGSRSHMSPETEDYIHKLKEKHGEIEFLSAGSALKLCLVAEGKADLYPRLGPTMEWDTAAGQVLVEQTGGSVISAENGERLTYNKKDLLNPFFIAGKLL